MKEVVDNIQTPRKMATLTEPLMEILFSEHLIESSVSSLEAFLKSCVHFVDS